jgi:hypothetical protein
MVTATPEPVCWLVCGCQAGLDHESGCDLGPAETIAAEAAARARETGGHQLVAAITALVEAGILRDLPHPDDEHYLLGVLDALWEGHLLGPAGGER